MQKNNKRLSLDEVLLDNTYSLFYQTRVLMRFFKKNVIILNPWISSNYLCSDIRIHSNKKPYFRGQLERLFSTHKKKIRFIGQEH